jgi:PAS domain S-box-containing protein
LKKSAGKRGTCKKEQNAFVESEPNYRSLFENCPDGILIFDLKGRITGHSDAFSKCGYKQGDLIGKHVFRFLPKKYWKRVRHDFLRLARGRPARGELVLETPKGTVQVEFNSSPVEKDGRVTGVQCMLRDITGCRRTETELQKSLSLLHATIESTVDGVLIVDREGRIVGFNSRFVEMWHVPRHIIASRDSHEVLAFVLRWLKKPREFLARVKRLYRHPGVESYDTIEFKDGRVFERYSRPQKIGRRIVGRVWSFRDVSEKKNLEARLSALNAYGAKLNGARSLRGVYRLTLEAVERTLGHSYATFEVLKGDRIEFACQRGYSKQILWAPIRLSEAKRSVVVNAAKTGKPMLVPDVGKNADYLEICPGIKSELAVPILEDRRVLGVLNVESRRLNAFSEGDALLLQILASHAATAMSNIMRRNDIQGRNRQQAWLMKSSAEMIRTTSLHLRLQAILDAVRKFGWRRVVLSVRDENLEITRPQDIVTSGLTKTERAYLWKNRQPGRVWLRRIGPEFSRFRIGEFYYLPWNDPWVRKNFGGSVVMSHLKPEDMVDWNPDDLLYAPLKLADGRVVGIVSIDDPLDGKRPTRDSLAPLEMFLHQAAVAIENAQLLQQLREYAGKLEQKVAQRTRELQKAQAQLMKSERLAAIGELAGMVGHDLRNPLTGIAGATYFLKTRLRSKGERRVLEMLNLIQDNIKCSDKIIGDLLEYSREIRLEVSEANPKLLVQDALSAVQVPRNVRVVNKVGRKIRLQVDKDKMRRVFINIIRNAFDAMPKGGTLTIESEDLGDSVAFNFSDTGVGMSSQTLAKVWSPLFTTKAKGMGFGLPICKRLVEAHSGRISVESRVGEGTTFTVTIPVEPKVDQVENNVWVNLPESLSLTTHRE